MALEITFEVRRRGDMTRIRNVATYAATAELSTRSGRFPRHSARASSGSAKLTCRNKLAGYDPAPRERTDYDVAMLLSRGRTGPHPECDLRSRMKSLALAVHDYIATFGGTFPCGHEIESDGSNVHASTPVSRRSGRRYWRLRCTTCHAPQPRVSPAASQAGAR